MYRYNLFESFSTRLRRRLVLQDQQGPEFSFFPDPEKILGGNRLESLAARMDDHVIPVIAHDRHEMVPAVGKKTVIREHDQGVGCIDIPPQVFDPARILFRPQPLVFGKQDQIDRRVRGPICIDRCGDLVGRDLQPR